MMQKAHLGGYYICHDAMGRHLLPKSAAVRYLSLLKIVAVMSLLGVNLCKQLALCFPSILPELYVSQYGEILSPWAFLFPFTSIFWILMQELHAESQKEILVSSNFPQSQRKFLRTSVVAYKMGRIKNSTLSCELVIISHLNMIKIWPIFRVYIYWPLVKFRFSKKATQF